MLKKLLIPILFLGVSFNQVKPVKVPHVSVSKIAKTASTTALIAGGVGLAFGIGFAPQVAAQVGENIAKSLGGIAFEAVKQVVLAVPNFCTGAVNVVGNGFKNVAEAEAAEFISSCGTLVLGGIGAKYLFNKVKITINWFQNR